MRYKIEYMPKVLKELDKIEKGDKKTREKIDIFLKDLEDAQNPRRFGNVKKLVNVENTYRWRVGKYRIVGSFEDDILVILIVKIDKREDVYKDL